MLKPIWLFRCVLFFLLFSQMGRALASVEIQTPFLLQGKEGEAAELQLGWPERGNTSAVEGIAGDATVYVVPEGVRELRLEPKPISISEDLSILNDYKDRYRVFWFMTMTWLVIGFGQR